MHAEIKEAANPLESLVFLSNSVPKSGSTYLAALQENFICGLKPGILAPEEQMGGLGLDLRRNYVVDPYGKEFLDFISNSEIEGGPYVFKTHFVMEGDLKDVFLESPHIHASLSVRDPLEIFMSGRDNYLATGEFTQFADIDDGIGLIQGYFADILKSTISVASTKEIPIVRYDEIVRSPKAALLKSLNQDLRGILLSSIVAEKIDIEAANEIALYRRNKAEVKRDFNDCDKEEMEYLTSELSDVRKFFGYLR